MTHLQVVQHKGLQGGVPELCGIAEVQMLSITNISYYSDGNPGNY